nr:RNA-directed DNA polymerase, eukaryota [Tanacetum cinerariifolium]
MSSIRAWDETVNKLKLRLFSWKLKTLSIGGRLTLLKSVLGSTPIYNMSLFKVPKAVLKSMESIRRNIFNGIRDGEKKIAWEQLDELASQLSDNETDEPGTQDIYLKDKFQWKSTAGKLSVELAQYKVKELQRQGSSVNDSNGTNAVLGS